MTFKCIWTCRTWLGEFQYRVMGDDTQVLIESRHIAGTGWKKIGTSSRSVWDEFAIRRDLYNPYRNNPSEAVKFMNEQILKNENHDQL